MCKHAFVKKQMISLNALRELLGSSANNYGETELEEIRQDIYNLANIAFDIYKRNPKILDKY